ncbi:hypothetical protein [Thalassoroseus pseudoceratinae]|uniref:hypothetical protein n=1 Tax=Thalassoroseus pseudoceratinae TaxID=2713176 RepID=UPI00141E3AF1|nr:hypothetical protein [Thalassoroseus pseudoceratinae]
MVELYPVWNSEWTTSSVASESLEHDDTTLSEAIDNDGVTGTELFLWINYGEGNPLDSACVVKILRDVDGTNYESEDDAPYTFCLPIGYAEAIDTSETTNTRSQLVFVDSRRASKFKVHVTNRTGGDVIVSLYYRTVSLHKENSA